MSNNHFGLTMLRKITIYFFVLIQGAAFSQNTLADYISAAQKNSPLINDNKNLSKVNELEAERLKAFYTKPQVGVTANYLFAPIISFDDNKTKFEPNPSGATKYVGYDMAASNGGTYQGLISLTQPLFNGKRYEAFAEQTSVNKQISQNTVKLSSHDLEKLVTDQYILYLLDKRQWMFVDSMLVILNDQSGIVKKLVESSLLKQSDLSLLNIEIQNNKGLLTTYKATYRRDLMDLNVLCGISDTTFVLLKDVELSPAKEVVNSAYLEKYRLDSLNLNATQKIFETKYRPQLNAFGNAGLNAVYAPTLPNRFGVSGGLSLNWNLFDGNQKSVTRKKTELQMQTVSFYRDNFLLQNNIRKNKILNELKSYDDRRVVAQTQLQEYTNLLGFYKKEIIQGQLSILSYVTVLKNMTIAKRDYFLLEANRLLLINAYNYWNW